MKSNTVETFFAPAERTPDEMIMLERLVIERNPTVLEMLEGFPDLALLLNQNRQIVAFNSKAVNFVPENLRSCVYGMRPGEAIDCIHAHEMPAGCGTSRFCMECGAVKAIVHTINNKEPAIEECRITRKKNEVEESLDLRVHTTIITIEATPYTLFSIKNIADEKRRFALERIFFHDIINTAGALNGLIQLLTTAEGDDLKEFMDTLPIISSHLLNEILGQRQLLSAEAGELVPEIKLQSLNKIVNAAGVLYIGHQEAAGKKIIVLPLMNDIEIRTDETMLIRSIGNLIKNALEASVSGDEIKISIEVSEDRVLIHVWNNSVMPPSVQLQMFQRSFSTKAKNGRGIGTYSVKLLIEQYLQGKIWFVSNEKEKTIFSIALNNFCGTC